MERLDAVILAGGVNRVVLYGGYVPDYKGRVPIAGRPRIRCTLDAADNRIVIERLGRG